MLNIGTTVASRYIIEAVVGHGGMGTIYRAKDTRLGRTVALKVLRPDLAADRRACAHFLREGQIAAQMVHANVVRTYDAGEDQAGPFLVQELLSGRTLDQVMPLPPQRAASILSDVAAALSYIHNRGYIHCDVKPQNILLKNDGTPVLLDFGIARAEGAAATTLIATPHYLAPERAQGSPPTVAADLYALGIILFQSIEGHPPFDASSIHAIIQQHTELLVPLLSVADPMVPVLNGVIARLTAKQPDDRYTSAEAVREDLAAIARSAGHAFPTLAVPPALPAPQSSASTAASPPRLPHPPVERLQQAAVTWSNLPAWRKRRWIAYLVGALFLLSLAYAIARGNRAAEAQRAPDMTQPAIVETPPAILETPPAIVETQPDNEEVVLPAPTPVQISTPEPTPPTPEALVPANDAPADQPDNPEPEEPVDQSDDDESDERAEPPGQEKEKEKEKEKDKDKDKDKDD